MITTLMRAFPYPLRLADYTDDGWPFETLPVPELELINCPNLVIPATLLVRDQITIKERGITLQLVFDDPVRLRVTGITLSHVFLDQLIGKPIGALVDIRQLKDHPAWQLPIAEFKVWKNGFDIELG